MISCKLVDIDLKSFSDLCRHSIYDPICISGSQALVVGVGEEVKGTELRPLVYHYFEINKIEGSYLILNNAELRGWWVFLLLPATLSV